MEELPVLSFGGVVSNREYCPIIVGLAIKFLSKSEIVVIIEINSGVGIISIMRGNKIL
jgi:hypothetical protein